MIRFTNHNRSCSQRQKQSSVEKSQEFTLLGRRWGGGRGNKQLNQSIQINFILPLFLPSFFVTLLQSNSSRLSSMTNPTATVPSSASTSISLYGHPLEPSFRLVGDDPLLTYLESNWVKNDLLISQHNNRRTHSQRIYFGSNQTERGRGRGTETIIGSGTVIRRKMMKDQQHKSNLASGNGDSDGDDDADDDGHASYEYDYDYGYEYDPAADDNNLLLKCFKVKTARDRLQHAGGAGAATHTHRGRRRERDSDRATKRDGAVEVEVADPYSNLNHASKSSTAEMSSSPSSPSTALSLSPSSSPSASDRIRPLLPPTDPSSSSSSSSGNAIALNSPSRVLTPRVRSSPSSPPPPSLPLLPLPRRRVHVSASIGMDRSNRLVAQPPTPSRLYHPDSTFYRHIPLKRPHQELVNNIRRERNWNDRHQLNQTVDGW